MAQSKSRKKVVKKAAKVAAKKPVKSAPKKAAKKVAKAARRKARTPVQAGDVKLAITAPVRETPRRHLSLFPREIPPYRG